MNITLRHTLLTGCAVLALLAAAPVVAPVAAKGAADWTPAASERLIKLPPHMLEKAVDRDFRASALSAALDETGDQIQAKGQTLTDLKGAAEQAEGELHTELKHQFLAEKQAYVRLMGARLEMRAAQAETRKKLYDRLLAETLRSGRADDRVSGLLADQHAARSRFETSLDAVDMQVFGTEFATESRYGAQYAENKAHIDRLLAAIDAHPVNRHPIPEGEDLSREDYLRRLIADADAEIALIAQEDRILGFMAKLVALDAMALAEGLGGAEDGSVVGDTGPSLAEAVDLFVSN